MRGQTRLSKTKYAALRKLLDDLVETNSDDHRRLIENFIEELCPSGTRKKPTMSALPTNTHYGRKQRVVGKRSSLYKKAKQLFYKNRKLLAQNILENKLHVDGDREVPSVNDTQEHFTNLFSASSDPLRSPIDHPPPASSWLPISEAEVDSAKIKWKNSAPGPDGTSVSTVARTDSFILVVLFNIITITGIVPSRFKSVRTILLFKSGQKSDINNWRPITISSAVQRLHHRIMAHRLQNLPNLDLNQRGFAKIDGTLANISIIDTYIRERKAANKQMAVVLLDITKAFDTVSQQAINTALANKGVDTISRSYIMSSMGRVYTTIKTGNNTTNPICPNRGVRQGDPLSPILFNITIDDLLASHNNGKLGGSISESHKVNIVAFADDIIILEDNPVVMLNTLVNVTSFLKRREMVINPKKCSALVHERIATQMVIREKPIYEID